MSEMRFIPRRAKVEFITDLARRVEFGREGPEVKVLVVLSSRDCVLIKIPKA